MVASPSSGGAGPAAGCCSRSWRAGARCRACSTAPCTGARRPVAATCWAPASWPSGWCRRCSRRRRWMAPAALLAGFAISPVLSWPSAWSRTRPARPHRGLRLAESGLGVGVAGGFAVGRGGRGVGAGRLRRRAGRCAGRRGGRAAARDTLLPRRQPGRRRPLSREVRDPQLPGRDQLVLLVVDLHVPQLRRAAAVHRRRDGLQDCARPRGAQQVRVVARADNLPALAEPGRTAALAERLDDRAQDAAVQQAVRLQQLGRDASRRAPRRPAATRARARSAGRSPGYAVLVMARHPRRVALTPQGQACGPRTRSAARDRDHTTVEQAGSDASDHGGPTR